MPSPLRLVVDAAVRGYARLERWIFAILGVAFIISFVVLLLRFRGEATLMVPASGGTYIEGSIGDLLPINPWFTVNNDVNRDLVTLIFAGLLTYNPQTQKIEEDLATLEVSKDGKIYTAHLKDLLFWHDSTAESRHPVTADDVVFTFQTVQHSEFPNTLLRRNFQGVQIEKINDKTVQFRLEQPYSFFPSNLTLGLLPKRAFEGVPVSKLDQSLDFGFSPIGAGPYRFKSIVQTELSTEVTLEKFSRANMPEYHLDRIVLRIFPDYTTLLSDVRNVDGIRLVPHTEQGPAIPQRFSTLQYSLPQYVAVFFNLDRQALKDQKLRLGLQLGTDKQVIAQDVGQSILVDTPLLAIDTSDWRYQFDAEAAQGALFESQWYFPEKIRLQLLLEQHEAGVLGPVRVPPITLLGTGAVLTLSGSLQGIDIRSKVNGIPLMRQPSSSGSWIVALPTHAKGTGSLKLGTNLVRLTDPSGKILDSAYVWRTTSEQEYARASVEQELLRLFLASREKAIPEQDRISIKDMFIERSFLRRRRAEDPVGVRINDAGQRLSLTLLTSPSPPQYAEVAEDLQKQWAQLGVEVRVEIPETRTAFEDRLLQRDYDLLLFGQSLLDNLDSYPYWHSSGIQKLTGNRRDLRLDAYNLSQYASFETDTLLETLRKTTNATEQQDTLRKLHDIFRRDVPTIILYSPLYTFAYRNDIEGIDLGKLSLHSDRFLTLNEWYVKKDRIFKEGEGWFSFISWLLSLVQPGAAPETDD